MYKDSPLSAVKHELSLVGITPDIDDQGKHTKIKWRSPKGAIRIITVAKTASDYRAQLNERARARRMLKEDGCYDKKPATEVSLITKAFSIPPMEHEEPLKNRVINLEKQMKELEEFLLETLSSGPIQVEPVAPMTPLPAELPPTIIQKSTNLAGFPIQRKIKRGKLGDAVLDALDYTIPKSPRELSKLLDRENTTVSAYLDTLKKEGKVKSLGRGQWIKLHIKGASHGK